VTSFNPDAAPSLPVPFTGRFKNVAYVCADLFRSVAPSNYTVATLVPSGTPNDPLVLPLIVCHSITTSSPYNLTIGCRRACIWTYNTTEELAVQDCENARGWLVSAQFLRGNHIRGLKVVGEPAYLPDPDDPAKTPRAQMTVDLQMKSTTRPLT
jgi:hypothetical protein